jgi:predicted secreted Zn-dependent protease
VIGRWFWLLAAFGALLLPVSLPATAKPKFPTQYTYYLVSGNSPSEVHKSLLLHGPRLRGIKAYASTALANPKLSGILVSNGKSCSYKNFSFNANFVINLPKLKSGNNLQGNARQNWRNFVSFAKRHEEEHRSIWMGCWRTLINQVAAVRESDCNKVERRVTALLKASANSCEAKHEVFDQREQVALRWLPFIRQSASR